MAGRLAGWQAGRARSEPSLVPRAVVRVFPWLGEGNQQSSALRSLNLGLCQGHMYPASLWKSRSVGDAGRAQDLNLKTLTLCLVSVFFFFFCSVFIRDNEVNVVLGPVEPECCSGTHFVGGGGL